MDFLTELGMISFSARLRRLSDQITQDVVKMYKHDGISVDLRRLCLASGLAAEIAAPPRYAGATLEQALHGGEDYELLFCARPERVPAEFEGLPLTRIGTMRKGAAGLVKLDGAPLPQLGYDHLRQHEPA